MSTIEFNSQFTNLTSLLNAFAYNLTRNVEDARDLLQETAFRALSNRDKFRPGTNFKAWLMTIMKNIFINNYRKKLKANTIIDTTENLYYLNSGKNTVQNEAESQILMDEITKILNDLDISLKRPFEMHYLGYKYQEIADELDLPLGTIKSRIFFARKELKERIESKYGDAFRIYSKEEK